jgi:hypothetical protein
MSMAGTSSDQQEAAVMTPRGKPWRLDGKHKPRHRAHHDHVDVARLDEAGD